MLGPRGAKYSANEVPAVSGTSDSAGVEAYEIIALCHRCYSGFEEAIPSSRLAIRRRLSVYKPFFPSGEMHVKRWGSRRRMEMEEKWGKSVGKEQHVQLREQLQ